MGFFDLFRGLGNPPNHPLPSCWLGGSCQPIQLSWEVSRELGYRDGAAICSKCRHYMRRVEGRYYGGDQGGATEYWWETTERLASDEMFHLAYRRAMPPSWEQREARAIQRLKR